ncbi:MAG: hypothetical protein K6G64_00570 [Eubacterium sp.]|nr:hypothetical protein [Eubacterium sp.]
MKKDEDTSDEKYIINLNKAWSLSKSWKRAAIIWRTLDHIFVIGSFTFSIFVVFISAIDSNAKILIIVFSSLAAIFTLIGFACNPTKYMREYRLAFQILNEALISYTDEEGKIKGGKNGYIAIGEAIKKGERYIGKTFEVDNNYVSNESELF